MGWAEERTRGSSHTGEGGRRGWDATSQGQKATLIVRERGKNQCFIAMHGLRHLYWGLYTGERTNRKSNPETIRQLLSGGDTGAGSPEVVPLCLIVLEELSSWAL